MDATYTLLKLQLTNERDFTFYVICDRDITRNGRIIRARRTTKVMRAGLCGMVVMPHSKFFTELSVQQKQSANPPHATVPYDLCHHVGGEYPLNQMPPNVFPMAVCTTNGATNVISGETRRQLLVLGRREGAVFELDPLLAWGSARRRLYSNITSVQVLTCN